MKKEGGRIVQMVVISFVKKKKKKHLQHRTDVALKVDTATSILEHTFECKKLIFVLSYGIIS